MNMTPRIDVDSNWLLSVLEEINKTRALAESEVALIERLVEKREPKPIRQRWTKDADRQLATMAKRRGGIRQFAAERGISPHAAHMRLCRIRASA